MSSFAPPTAPADHAEPVENPDVAYQLATLRVAVELNTHEVKLLREVQEGVMELLASIKDQVEPVLDGVANSPIGGMLGLKS